MDFCVTESPAAKALGPLFKLTEVHLWDDGSGEAQESSYVQEPLKLISSDRECEENDYSRANGFCSWPKDVDTELAKEMNDLGLPLTFRTNKEMRYGVASGKKKGSRKSYQQNPIETVDCVLDSNKGRDEESGSPASVLNTSEMLDQSDSKSKNEIVEEFCCLPNPVIYDACANTLSSEHELNVEASKFEFDDFACISDLDNNILYESECITCTEEMVATDLCQDCGASERICFKYEVDNCNLKEINSELNTSADGISNDINSEVIKDLDDVALNPSFSEESDSKMIYSSGEWLAYWDDFHMRTYFYNVSTQESTWDPPPGMEQSVYSYVANESTGTLARLSELDRDEIDTRMSEEVRASCDLQLVDDVAKENDAHSLGQQSDEIFAEWISVDNATSSNTTNKKKKARKSRNRKLSISIEDHSEVSNELPSSISKYWWQRYMLFSRFDKGIKMDEEGWFSVTPETLAKHHALRCGDGAIVDFFTGVGGNSIQFAQRSRHVVAIDIDPVKIDYARHNAALYGVDDRIDFINGDSFCLAPKLKADTVFLSPPWGGPDYSKVTKFDINSMLKPRDGKSLFDAGKRIAPKIVMFLPRNVDIDQLAELCISAVPPWSLEVEKNYLNGRLKAVTAYFSDPSIP